MKHKSSASLKAEIDRILANHGSRSPEDLITEIYNLARPIGEAGGDALLDRHPELFEYRPLLTQAYHATVVSKEIAEIKRILPLIEKCPTPFTEVASPRTMVTYNRVSEMFAAVDFSKCQRLVMVGCGRVPAAIFHVHDRTDIPDIVGLDILREAVSGARSLLTQLGYARATAVVCDGASYDYAGAQIVVIANMVSPKAEVVSRVADTGPAEVRVVVRDPLSLGRLWSDSVERALDPRFEIIGKGEGQAHWSLSRDLYLGRRGSAS
jgi:hypothetical protein